jgi:hypothetical protein
MPKIPSITEQELQNLAPSGLDEDFLSRLTACAEGTAESLSDDELDFENHLRSIQPRKIPAGFQSKLMEAVGDAPFPVDGTIVLFNKAAAATDSGKPRRFLRFNIAAAAAVALLGSIAAFMVPGEPAGNLGADAGSPKDPIVAPAIIPNSPEASNFAPASFNRNLSETRDEGVIWRGKNQPHRVLRLTYMDQVTVKGADGKSVLVEQPRVEYVIIPEKID